MSEREPHIYTPKHDHLPSVDVHAERCTFKAGDIVNVDGQPHVVRRVLYRVYGLRPFEDYTDQPDTAERVRCQVQAIPFALPEKKTDG
jgi:hypothetical protein